MKIYLWSSIYQEIWREHPDKSDLDAYGFTTTDGELIYYIQTTGKKVDAELGSIWELELDD
jgi:hypothetical protein